MERLTIPYEYGDGYRSKCAESCGECDGCWGMDEIVNRLGSYEDTKLTPAEVHSLWGEWNAMMSVLNSIGGYDRLRELAEADKEGRVAVLPCEVGGSMLNTIDIERPRIMKGLHFAVAYESVRGIIFYIPYDIFREYIDAGHVQPLHKLKEAQNGNKTDM